MGQVFVAFSEYLNYLTYNCSVLVFFYERIIEYSIRNSVIKVRPAELRVHHYVYPQTFIPSVGTESKGNGMADFLLFYQLL